jgi:uncharacterized protein with ParB-like and HNH nuclease domain
MNNLLKEQRKAQNVIYEDFFTKEKPRVCFSKLQIPEFQRNYVWKKTQIEDLLDSVKSNLANYYMGTIVIVANEIGGSERDSVVDGQQRLITLSLVCGVIHEMLLDQSLKDRIEETLFEGKSKNIRLRFKRDNLNKIYTKILKEEEIDEKELDPSQKKIVQANKIIKRWIKKNIRGKEAFVEFTGKILKLEFITISCLSDEDAYQLFEGLNSTGLSLSAVELTKNALLGKAKLLDKDKVNAIYDEWNNVESLFEKESKFLFSQFLRHQWFSIGGYVSHSQLFSEIKKAKIEKCTKFSEIETYIKKIKIDSEQYIKLREANISPAEYTRMEGFNRNKTAEFIFNIGKLEIDQIYSVLLALWNYKNVYPDYFRETFTQHIMKLWSFVFIMKYSGVTPSLYERKFAKLCELTKEKKYKKFEEGAEKIFKELQGVADVRVAFIKGINTRLHYIVSDSNGGFIKNILQDIHPLSLGENPTLEHIIPQEFELKWTHLEPTEISVLSKYIHKLGNLTLLETKLNKDSDGKIFTEKALIYAKSKCVGAKEIDSKYGSLFNSKNPHKGIEKRGEVLGGAIFDFHYKQISS